MNILFILHLFHLCTCLLKKILCVDFHIVNTFLWNLSCKNQSYLKIGSLLFIRDFFAGKVRENLNKGWLNILHLTSCIQVSNWWSPCWSALHWLWARHYFCCWCFPSSDPIPAADTRLQTTAPQLPGRLRNVSISVSFCCYLHLKMSSRDEGELTTCPCILTQSIFVWTTTNLSLSAITVMVSQTWVSK